MGNRGGAGGRGGESTRLEFFEFGKVGRTVLAGRGLGILVDAEGEENVKWVLAVGAGVLLALFLVFGWFVDSRGWAGD